MIRVLLLGSDLPSVLLPFDISDLDHQLPTFGAPATAQCLRCGSPISIEIKDSFTVHASWRPEEPI